MKSSNHKPSPEQLAQAWKARDQSYSPYSKRKVGAIVITTSGKIFGGANIENASFGGTVCAERVAVWKAISELGPDTKIEQVIVATDADPAWPPCGFCRQVINEFKTSDTTVHIMNQHGLQHTFSLQELLPLSFDPVQLIK
jgi:cytidine deaminase